MRILIDLCRRVFTFLSIGLLSACAASTTLKNNKDVVDIYVYAGPIDGRFLEVVQRAPENSILVITSPGGSETYGILAGQEIHNKRINLIVRGFCVSSCANYVVPSAASVTLEEDSLIGFHGTNFNNNLSSAKKSLNLQRLRTLFEMNGADLELVFCAESVLFTGEYESRDHTFPNGVTRRIRIPIVRKKLWVPSVEIMQKYGVEVQGEQPLSARLAAEIVRGGLTETDIEMTGQLFSDCAAV